MEAEVETEVETETPRSLAERRGATPPADLQLESRSDVEPDLELTSDDASEDGELSNPNPNPNPDLTLPLTLTLTLTLIVTLTLIHDPSSNPYPDQDEELSPLPARSPLQKREKLHVGTGTANLASTPVGHSCRYPAPNPIPTPRT